MRISWRVMRLVGCALLIGAIMRAVLDRAHFVERVLGRDELRARGVETVSRLLFHFSF